LKELPTSPPPQTSKLGPNDVQPRNDLPPARLVAVAPRGSFVSFFSVSQDGKNFILPYTCESCMATTRHLVSVDCGRKTLRCGALSA
jgi:hypothetical protein